MNGSVAVLKYSSWRTPFVPFLIAFLSVSVFFLTGDLRRLSGTPPQTLQTAILPAAAVTTTSNNRSVEVISQLSRIKDPADVLGDIPTDPITMAPTTNRSFVVPNDTTIASDRYARIEFAYDSPHLPKVFSEQATEQANPMERAAWNIRHTCLRKIRRVQEEAFSLLATNATGTASVLLVDAAYHGNVGDVMLTEAEKLFLRKLNLTCLECYLKQGRKRPPHPPPYCRDTEALHHFAKHHNVKIALWQGGGSWGDLYHALQGARIQSMETLLRENMTVIGMPQSYHYNSEELAAQDAAKLLEGVKRGLLIPEQNMSRSSDMATIKEKVVWTWRQKESFQKAQKRYPLMGNVAVPDMAFQLGPFNAHRPAEKDILVFLRDDKESRSKRYRNPSVVQSLLNGTNLTFEIVDWNDRQRLFNSTWLGLDEIAIRLMSFGKVVIADRLHATILAYLIGLPIIYVDQTYGKINKTLSLAFESWEGCLDFEQSMVGYANTFPEALSQAKLFLKKYNL